MLLEGYSVPCGGAEITFMDAVTADCIIIFSLLKVIAISVKRKKNWPHNVKNLGKSPALV